MKIITLNQESKRNILEDLLKRSPNHYGEYEKIVNDIIEQVRIRKDEAVFDFTEKFDQIRIDSDSIKVTEEEINQAFAITESKYIDIMKNEVTITQKRKDTKERIIKSLRDSIDENNCIDIRKYRKIS